MCKGVSCFTGDLMSMEVANSDRIPVRTDPIHLPVRALDPSGLARPAAPHYHASRTMRRFPSLCAAILVFPLLTGTLTSLVAAQAIERQLDDEGNWQLTPEEEAQLTPAENLLHRARQALAQKRYDRARRLADTFIEDYPEHPEIAQGYLVRGEARMRGGDEYKALYDFEFIARMHPGSEAFTIALEREFEIAQKYAAGTRRKLWGIRWILAYQEAEELLIRIQERLPGSKLAERAARALADHYYDQRDMPLAATTYEVYLKNYPRAVDHAAAMQRLIFSHLASYRGPRFDTSGLEEARGWISTLEAQHPAQAQQIGTGALTDRIREARAEKILVDARWYLKRDDEVSARFVLNRLIKRHGDTLAAADGYRIMVEYGWIDAGQQPPELGSDAPTKPADEADTAQPTEDAQP